MITPSTVVINKSIFEKYGMFDTNLQACEDYDLWLRITFKETVGYINKNLAIRNAGHEGQLSEQFEALDKFRLYSILKLLALNYTSNNKEKISSAIETLNSKALILKNGALKRKNFDLAETLNKILEIKDHSVYSQINFQNLLKVLNIEKDMKQDTLH
jgi:hypothetical protein